MPTDYPLTREDKQTFRTLSNVERGKLKDLQIALQSALITGNGVCRMDGKRCTQRGIHYEIGGTAVVPIEIYPEDPVGSDLLSKILYRMIDIENDGDDDEEDYPRGYGRNAANLRGLVEMTDQAIHHFEVAESSRNYDKGCVLASLHEMKRVIELILEWYQVNILKLPAFQ